MAARGVSGGLSLFERVGVPYECWDADTIRQRVPGLDSGRYGPPKLVTDEAFWTDADGEFGAYFTPDGGFIDDPQLATRNLIAAAKLRGAEVQLREEVVAILQKKARVQGVKLRTGSVIDSPIVVNVAGPHSSRVNSLAGVPIYDRTSLGGFYVAIGTSRNQFKNAPVVGRFMATLICACGNGHDHDADPVVVQGRFTRNAINLGHCSRLRQPYADSAFNVMG